MKHTESAWILLCDLKGGRLLQAHQTATGKPRLEEVEQQQSGWVEAERHRPAPTSTCGVQDHESWEGIDQEQVRFRAREILDWYRKINRTRQPERMLLVVPGALGGQVRTKVQERPACDTEVVLSELAPWPTHRLAEHKVVTRWLQGAPA